MAKNLTNLSDSYNMVYRAHILLHHVISYPCGLSFKMSSNHVLRNNVLILFVKFLVNLSISDFQQALRDRIQLCSRTTLIEIAVLQFRSFSKRTKMEKAPIPLTLTVISFLNSRTTVVVFGSFTFTLKSTATRSALALAKMRTITKIYELPIGW